MERTFRISGVYRGLARAALLRFVVLCGVATAAFASGVLDRCRVPAVVVVALFMGLAACLNLYLALAWWRERLVIRPGQVIHRGLLFRNELDWDHVRIARWRHRGHGALRLSTQDERTTLRFAHFEPADRLWLIRLLRRALPQEAQRNWDCFCLQIAMPLRDEAAGIAGPVVTLQDNASSDRRRRIALLRRWGGLALAAAVLFACLPHSAVVAVATAGGPILAVTLAVWVVWHTRRRRQRMSWLRAEAVRRWDEAESAALPTGVGEESPCNTDRPAHAAPQAIPCAATAP